MREILETTRASEYFDVNGLQTLTGLTSSQWPFAILKELLDNSLDAIDELDDKRIEIVASEDKLEIYDSGQGIPEEDLDRIFNFDIYASSKRDFRTPTRGFQGNALKTVIGITHLFQYGLTFLTGGKAITYKVNPYKLQAGHVEFEKFVVDSTDDRSGVLVSGIDGTKIISSWWPYRLANPDVTFIVNGKDHPFVISSIKRTEKTFIHWYDLQSFSDLIQKFHSKDPTRTVKDFASIFSGTQRVISRLDFPYKRLCDFYADDAAIEQLYGQLKALTKAPRPDILTKYATGKDVLLNLYGVPEGDCRYKQVSGSYTEGEAEIPYLIEGFLFNDKDEAEPALMLTAVNCSVPYRDLPFEFDWTEECILGKKTYEADSLQAVLDQSGFSKALGVLLYLNFVSPRLVITDKAKTRIISDKFKDDLLKVTDYCCRDAIKEVKRADRANRPFVRSHAMKTPKHAPKYELMERHFLEAYERASGGYTVTIRQVFYVVREIVNTLHGEDLRQTDYKTFRQKIATERFERYPDLEKKIFFERRGFFKDPFHGEDVPLGTADVLRYIEMSDSYSDQIYDSPVRVFSIPINLKYNSVLFIEKQGFNAVMQESGLIDKLNLGVISTQGFGTRAGKKLIQYFIEQGIKVYVLHDCDIAGYLIQENMAHGSNTFSQGLEVEEIGLTVGDIKSLRKELHAEIIQPSKPYSGALEIFSEEELDFFVVDPHENKYRRVEINSLTNPELIEFIESRIKPDPIKPSTEQIERYLPIDEDEILKEALIGELGDRYPFQVDRRKLAREVQEQIKPGEHWTTTMDNVIAQWKREKISELGHLIRGTL